MVTSATYAKDPITNENICINATIDGVAWSIPMDENNVHYQGILEWVADGNTIEESS